MRCAQELAEGTRSWWGGPWLGVEALSAKANTWMLLVGSREPWKFSEQWNRSIRNGVISCRPSFVSLFARLHIHRLKRTRVFLFSTSVRPFFVSHASEGKHCQHSAVLTRDSHLLVTKGYSKNMIPF